MYKGKSREYDVCVQTKWNKTLYSSTVNDPKERKQEIYVCTVTSS